MVFLLASPPHFLDRHRHTSPTKMKLFTYAGNVHALQSLIVARYNGVEIELPPFEMGKDNKTKAFLAKSPMGEPEPEASP